MNSIVCAQTKSNYQLASKEQRYCTLDGGVAHKRKPIRESSCNCSASRYMQTDQQNNDEKKLELKMELERHCFKLQPKMEQSTQFWAPILFFRTAFSHQKELLNITRTLNKRRFVWLTHTHTHFLHTINTSHAKIITIIPLDVTKPNWHSCTPQTNDKINLTRDLFFIGTRLEFVQFKRAPDHGTAHNLNCVLLRTKSYRTRESVRQ